MNKTKIYSDYIKKITILKKYNQSYYDDNKPDVTDEKYDELKKKILELEKNFDLVVCIISSKKNRIKRILKHKKFTKENLNKIFKAQTTDKERKKRSQIIINNNKTKKDFIFNIEKVLIRLIKWEKL